MTFSTNEDNVRLELLNSLRNADVFGASSTTIRGVTTQVDTFTATSNQTNFQLTETQVRNVRSVTDNAVNLYLYKDYTFNPTTGVLTLLVGAALNDTVVVTYDYSAQGFEKIYPDFPRDDLKLDSFPRVGFALMPKNIDNFTLGATAYLSDRLVTFVIWIPVNNDSKVSNVLAGTANLYTIVSNIENWLKTNSKSFYTFPFIYPTTIGQISTSTNNKIFQLNVDARMKFIIE